MKKLLFSSFTLALFTIAFSLTPQAGVPSVAAPGPGRSVSLLYPIEGLAPDGSFIIGASEVPGATSKLLRTHNGLTVNIHTSGLRPGAYTLWWGIYNNPQHCTNTPCGGEDDFNPDVETFWAYANGHVLGRGNSANLSAHLNVGGPYGEVFSDVGLLNPMGAQVQLVVRYHGPVIPGIVTEQTTTFDGGCLINDCKDEQFAVHNP